MEQPTHESIGKSQGGNRALGAFIKNNADGIIIVDRYGTVLFVNPAAEKFLHRKSKKILGKPFEFPLPAGDSTEIELTFRSGRAVTAEMRVSRLKWYEETIFLVSMRNPEDHHLPVLPFHVPPPPGWDSELKRTEKSLRSTRRRLKKSETEVQNLTRFIEKNPDPIFRMTLQGEILYANGPAKELLHRWAYVEEEPLTERILQGIRGADHSFNVETQLEDHIYSFHLVTVSDSGYIDVYGKDITETKRLEAQFFQAQKMEAVGRLAGGIAHDFNNMMTVVTGYSESLLQDLTEESPHRSMVSEIMNAGKRAASLTQQLLAFSRKQVLQPQILDLNGVVNGIENMIRHLVGEDIGFSFLPEPELGYVKADAGQIDQVILNLVVNARDAMPRGGQLTVETANAELDTEYSREHIAVTPGAYIMLAVSDTGTGMDHVTRARVFEPFFTTKEHGKGTGLGLSTVYGIIKQSGGNIWAYSEPGQGSTFKIYLPRVTESGKPSRKTVKTRGETGGTETVLLVEDEELVRRFACRALTEKGYRVLPSGSGEEALRVVGAEKSPIHLILTDVILPDINGPELTNRIAAVQPKIKTLYMSGYADRSIVYHGTLKEGEHFLQKPFSATSLLNTVREVLDMEDPCQT